jgi:hypothetical protein
MLGTFTFIDQTFGKLGYSSSEGKQIVETGATEGVKRRNDGHSIMLFLHELASLNKESSPNIALK